MISATDAHSWTLRVLERLGTLELTKDNIRQMKLLEAAGGFVRRVIRPELSLV
jgi:hypothetical protein